MSFTVGISRHKSRFERLPKRVFNGVLTRVMLAYAIGWNHLFKMRHFGETAAERYGYARRAGERRGQKPIKGSYTWHKLRLHKHTRPLEFSGDGRREAARHLARGGRRRGGVYWSRATLPRVFNLRNPAGRSDPPKETTKVLPSELRVLHNLGQQKADAEFRRHSGYRG